jgi:hypothetical protein
LPASKAQRTLPAAAFKEDPMDQRRLTELIETPEVHRRLLAGYEGPYALGITRDPEDESRLALRLRIEAERPPAIPDEIVLDGEAVPVVVDTRFRGPVPLKS